MRWCKVVGRIRQSSARLIVLMVDVVRLMGSMVIVVLMMLSVMAMRLLCVMLNRPISVYSRHHACEPPSSTRVHYASVLLVVSLVVHGAIWVVMGR